MKKYIEKERGSKKENRREKHDTASGLGKK